MSLVSVLIPCYGHQATLRRALLSLCLQDYQNWEAIVVDDGSSPPIIPQQLPPDSRITLLRLSRNQGRGAASQLALRHSAGRYVAFLDADDWYLPGKVSAQVAFLEGHPQIDCVAGTLGCITDEGAPLRLLMGQPSGLYRHNATSDLKIPFAACMTRGDMARNTGFDARFRRGQDRDFLHRLLLGRLYAIVPEVEYIYSTGSSFSLRAVLEGLRYRLRFHQKFFSDAPLWALRKQLWTLGQLALYPALRLCGWWPRHMERNLRPAPHEVLVTARQARARLEDLLRCPGS